MDSVAVEKLYQELDNNVILLGNKVCGSLYEQIELTFGTERQIEINKVVVRRNVWNSLNLHRKKIKQHFEEFGSQYNLNLNLRAL